MACLDSCRYCGGWKRCSAISCDECNGSNARRSYKERTANLAECLKSAAVEEARTRHVLSRVWKKYGAELRAARGMVPCR